jgi:pseudouridine-5'-phosphate glycosidase
MITQNIIAFFCYHKPAKVSIKCQTAGHITKIMLTDGGLEFDCGAVQKVLEYGITHLPARQYTPEQNYEAEQENCTTVVNACSVLHASGLLKEFGAET